MALEHTKWPVRVVRLYGRAEKLSVAVEAVPLRLDRPYIRIYVLHEVVVRVAGDAGGAKVWCARSARREYRGIEDDCAASKLACFDCPALATHKAHRDRLMLASDSEDRVDPLNPSRLRHAWCEDHVGK